MDPTGRRVMPEDMAAMGMPKGMPPHNMYMGEVRYGYCPAPRSTPRNLLHLLGPMRESLSR